ncbi:MULTISPECIES: hypothetical protein [unclassified Bacillus (in: firmicutes)]|uniref:hypothetical protein n=1 Tax=unclassified Bacillus (in: firmicutes) TaxID=185979 RepID=UPI002FFE0A7A
MIEVLVKYISFPDIEDGVSSFYHYSTDKGCSEPNKPYTSGYCHTIAEELDELAVKVGFTTRSEFAAELQTKYWKNAYGKELSQYVGKALESTGITLNINGTDIIFKCPENEFVLWPAKR